MIHLRSVKLRDWKRKENPGFPFTVPVIQSLGEINFSSSVTFLVGENGSGKSTFLEALACAVNSVTVGSESVKTDPTLASIRKLAQHFSLSWQRRTHKGFFLRAEDFFGYAKQVRQVQEELRQEVENVAREYKDRSAYAAGLARMPYKRGLADIERRYGAGLDNQSHGENFLTLFQNRFVPDGLYLLDEPEAALSPYRQLGFLYVLKQMVAQDSQFIIATHSPIILAFPGATILSFDSESICDVEYKELEHVNLTRDFLNNPPAFLRHL